MEPPRTIITALTLAGGIIAASVLAAGPLTRHLHTEGRPAGKAFTLADNRVGTARMSAATYDMVASSGWGRE